MRAAEAAPESRPTLRSMPNGALEAPGKDIVDRDVVRDRFASEARDEAGEAAARAVRERELRDRGLHRARSDIDDAPEAPRDHSVDRGFDQLDRGEHIGADRLQPVLPREFAEIPGRRAAGVGDENVRVRAGGERRSAAFLARDVGGDDRDRRSGRGADFAGGLLQRFALAGDKGRAAAFARERRGASPAESLACAAYERGLAMNTQIHEAISRSVILQSEASAVVRSL